MENNKDEKNMVNNASPNRPETEEAHTTVNLPNKEMNASNMNNNQGKKNKKKPFIFNFSGKKNNKKNEVPSSSIEKKEEGPKNPENIELPVMVKVDEQEAVQSPLPEMPAVNEERVPSVPSTDLEQKETVSNATIPAVENTLGNQNANLGTVQSANTPENNFVPPADFSSIFNVESEEKAVLPASVKLEDNVNKEVQNIGKKDGTIVLGNAQPENEEKDTKEEPKGAVFNSKERLLYEIKPEKEGNPIVVVLFFAFLLSMIVILPYISKKYDLWTGKNNDPVTAPEEEESEYYYFNRSSVRAKIGGLEFTNFVKSKQNREYFLTFNITNTNSNAYQFDKKYYVVFYDGESVVYRALIYAYEAIGSNAATEVTLTINERGYNSADKFKIAEVPVAAYPEVETTEKDGDYSVLKCNYINDEVKYYFLDKKLAKIKETYTETFDSSANYESQKVAYRNLSQSYKNVKNFNSTFVETNTYFTMINEFDHKDISDSTLYNLKTYKFFKYNENINTVSYELEAQGYTCS